MSKTTHVLFVSAMLFAAAGCKRTPAATTAPAPAAAAMSHEAAEAAAAALPRVTVDQVMAKIDHHEPIAIFDNNSRERFEQGHVPGARWVAYRSVSASDLPTDNALPLVFYCGSEQCSACHTAALTAITLGHTNVSIMPAGIRGWTAAGKPTVTGGSPS